MCIFQVVLAVESLPCRRGKRRRFSPWIKKIPWRRAWQPTPVFLPGESHGQRSLADYSLWDRKELDTAEQLSMYIYACTLSRFCCGLSFPTHTHTHTHTHTYINIYIHTYIHPYVCVYLSIYISCIHTKSCNCEIPS